ncbi:MULTISPECIES: histidine phosphatase family protein [unclassified Butyrivibrio]|uniref:histidine phosphatase family protein n=1 Tax=unclassified Butyrivibrio TaxID=2639466 RepID=UPI00088EF6E1|nr:MULTISPECIES: histidine phosphatase family protein [unclassified Butyrivibrio]SDB65835.1 Broad specificity phosphatase PhoE [Butyrivibrio sp. INlla16]SEM44637.1 Broad specificity phosphatase PhoE [Butyrivibrio sp. ob235]
MKVVLIRHGKVNFRWGFWYTSDQFDEACRQYDLAPIMKEDYTVPDVKYLSYYISTLPRTGKTARNIFGEQDYISTDLINEVPLSASLYSRVKLPVLFWYFTGRMQWYFNNSRQKEGRLRTKKRAKQFVKMLTEKNEDCVVVTHGFFMRTLVAEFKKAHFSIENNSFTYANGQCVIANSKKGETIYEH